MTRDPASVPPLHVALVEPEIPGNTGNIARFCAATRCHLHLVGPLGFSLDQKHLRRAGMDYWQYLHYSLWDNRTEFFGYLARENRRFFLLSTKVPRPYTEHSFQTGDTLVFGRESKGLPESLLASHPHQCLTIPLACPQARSLNLSTAAAVVTFEALRQISLA